MNQIKLYKTKKTVNHPLTTAYNGYTYVLSDKPIAALKEEEMIIDIKSDYWHSGFFHKSFNPDNPIPDVQPYLKYQIPAIKALTHHTNNKIKELIKIFGFKETWIMYTNGHRSLLNGVQIGSTEDKLKKIFFMSIYKHNNVKCSPALIIFNQIMRGN